MQECKRSAVSYISPEHILLALLSVPDTSGKRVLDRYDSMRSLASSHDRSLGKERMLLTPMLFITTSCTQ